MNTTNWQTKALTLFIAAVALWLTAACGNVDPTIETQPAPATTTTPTQVATQAPTIAAPAPQVGCTHETPETRSILNTSEGEYRVGTSSDWVLSFLVRNQYKDLLWRQPNVYDVSLEQLRDGEGSWTKTWGITVWVTKKVDQSTLPPEDRIPATLENVQPGNYVSVQIKEGEPQSKASVNNCDYSMCAVNPDASTVQEQKIQARIHDKYEPLLWRQPNVHSTGVWPLTDANGKSTGEWGIVIEVSKRVDQSALPPEDRIPDCLEGVPVQIRERQPVIGITGSIQKGDN